jgi:hypothetical protein
MRVGPLLILMGGTGRLGVDQSCAEVLVLMPICAAQAHVEMTLKAEGAAT